MRGSGRGVAGVGLGQRLDRGEGALEALFQLGLAVAEDQALDQHDEPGDGDGVEGLGERGRAGALEFVGPAGRGLVAAEGGELEAGRAVGGEDLGGGGRRAQACGCGP